MISDFKVEIIDLRNKTRLTAHQFIGEGCPFEIEIQNFVDLVDAIASVVNSGHPFRFISLD